MSGKIPMEQRPRTLDYNNQLNKSGNIKSTTPNGGGSRIPTPSPGVLRRSASLRIRGDRYALPSPNTTQQYNSNNCIAKPTHQQNVNNPFGLSNCKCYLSTGSVNTGPYSMRSPTTDRHMMPTGSNVKSPGTPLSNRKLIPKSPLQQNGTSTLQESPTRQRSLSLSLSSQALSPHTPPVSPDRGFDQDDEDDLDSLHSYSSLASTTSCDHAYVARNGTTFSGRKMKYVVHCSTHAGQTGEEYLTPTQRAQRQIRRLKTLLQQAKLDLEQKDSDIFRLTKEVVELRLYKASLNSPEEKSNSSNSEVLTVRENTPESPPPVIISTPMVTSCTDSGHFEEPTTKEQGIETDPDEREKLIEFYENKLQDLSKQHGEETQELKREHNDRVEALLKTLSEVNERYCVLMPDCESAKERIRELEKELDDVSSQLKDNEEKHRRVYLKLYQEHKDVLDGTCSNGTVAKLGDTSVAAASGSIISRVSVADLLHQLHVTQIELDNIKEVCQSADQQAASAQSLLSAKEAVSLWVLGARKAMYRRLIEARGSKSDLDPEVTLQFLKSAIYYFLTDKENHRGHLRAIESILGFSNDEISDINKAGLS